MYLMIAQTFLHLEKSVTVIVSLVDIYHWKSPKETVKMASWVQELDSIVH
jgi:hypothetical protein